MSALERLLNSFEKDTDEDGKTCWMYYGDVDPKDAAADLARLTAERDELKEVARKTIYILTRIANDEYCDNDGRGCGSRWTAEELATELAAALKDNS